LYKGNAQKLQENRAQNLKRQFILKHAPSSSSFNSPLPFLPPRFRWSSTFRYRRTYFCSCRWFSLCFSCTVSSSTSTVFSRSITYTTTPRTYTCRHFIVVVCFATRYDTIWPLAVLDPRVGRTMDVLSPFIPDWLFHGESCPRLDVVHPGQALRNALQAACGIRIVRLCIRIQVSNNSVLRKCKIWKSGCWALVANMLDRTRHCLQSAMAGNRKIIN